MTHLEAGEPKQKKLRENEDGVNMDHTSSSSSSSSRTSSSLQSVIDEPTTSTAGPSISKAISSTDDDADVDGYCILSSVSSSSSQLEGRLGGKLENDSPRKEERKKNIRRVQF